MRFLRRELGLSSLEKTKGERHGTLHEGGTVGAMLITAIKRFADRPAIADNQTRWTYRELGQAAGRVVALFRTLGLKKGDGVALLATNRVETWAVVTAAAVMGLRYTSLHPLAAEDDHAFIVDDAEVDALVVEGAKFAELLRTMRDMTTWFCDAYASWQKGGIENANGRLRRWLPRHLDIDRTSDQDIQEIVLTTNLTPRKCLGFKTPFQALIAELGKDVQIRFS